MNSSKSILHSTGVIGMSQVLSMVFNLLKSKVVAIFLGPEGTGLMSALQSSIYLVQGFAGFGIDNSAVRDVAKANASGDGEKLAATVKAQRRIVLLTGCFGAALVIGFSDYLSELTFGTEAYTWEIRLLSVAVFLNLIQGGQNAVLQGTRKIKEIALVTIGTAVLGAVFIIPAILLLGLDGISLYLVFLAMAQFAISWWFARKIKLSLIRQSFKETLTLSKDMFSVGFAFMGGTMTALLAKYIIRVMIVHDLSIEMLGIYQAGFVLSGIYINVILSAMGKDFYPRLAGVAFDAEKETQLINEQTEIGVILASPGLLFTLALSPWVIELLYSNAYIQAVPVLQWIILGVFIRIVTWPMGYLLVARAKAKLHLMVQLSSNVLHVVFGYFFLQWYGIEGLGMAFFGMYIFHFFIITSLTFYQNGFVWSQTIKRLLIFSCSLYLISFLLLTIYEGRVAAIVVLVFSILMTYRALIRVSSIMGANDLIDLYKIIIKKIRRSE